MIDGRLLAPACAAWVGAATALLVLDDSSGAEVRHGIALRMLAGATVVACALAVAAVPLRRRARTRPFLVSAALLLSGSGMAALGVAQLTPSPVGGWIDQRATATVRGVVLSEAVRRTSPTAPSWQDATWTQVRIATEWMSARGAALEVALPILVEAADGAAVPAPGSVVEFTGRLRPTSLARNAAASITTSAFSLVGEPGPLDAVAHAMRVGLRAALTGTEPDAGALVAGLAVGDESQQSGALAEAMRASGLSHLTAVSGGNVAIVLGAVLLVAAAARLSLVMRGAASLGALCFFVLLVGPQPSVLRAAAMGVVLLVALVAGGGRGGSSALGVAVIVLVHLQPWLALSWGFALSVLATVGLILLAPSVRSRMSSAPVLRRCPPMLLDAAALTIAAQLATAPMLVAMGASVGWAAVPANLVAMPAVGPVTVLGLIAAGIAPVAPAVATAVAHVAAWPAGGISWVAHTAAAAPGGALPLPDGWWGAGLLAVGGLVGVAGVRMGRRWLAPPVPRLVRRAAVGALIGAALMVVALPPSRRGWPPPEWLMIMCDVGQGDALLLNAGGGAAVVVDAGPDPSTVRGCLDDAGIRQVPAVVLTHFHADHAGGLAGVLEGRPVGVVLSTPIRDPAGEAAAVDDTLAEAGLSLTPITAGDARVVGDIRWRAIWPRRRIDAGSVPNNASVVLVADVRDRTILLAGDIEPEAQAAIAADIQPLGLDAIKVPHHGSRYQDPGITTWARAAVALISVGAGNDYGHPAVETVAAWEHVGALVARTDLDGDIALVRTPSGTGVVTRRDMLRAP